MKTITKGATINSEVLQEIGKVFGKVADKKGLRDNNLYLSEKEGKQSFYLSGSDISVERTIPLESGVPISTVVPTKEFRHKVGITPNNTEITLMEANSKLYFTWGKGAKLRVPHCNEQIPLLSIPEISDWIEWKPGTLHEVTREFMEFSCQESDERADREPVYTGVNFQRDSEFNETYIRATDKRKAASMSKEINWFNKTITISTTTLVAVAEIISAEKSIQVGINDEATLIVFKTSDTVVLSRVLDGQFNNAAIDKVFTLAPSMAETWYRVDLADIENACYRAIKLAPTSRLIKIFSDGSEVLYQAGQNVHLPKEGRDEEDLIEPIGGVVDSVKGVVKPIIVDAANLLAATKLFKMDSTPEITLLTALPNESRPGPGPVTVIDEDNQAAQALIGQIRH
ncbi:hypothetical protein QTG56_23830 (plasmid) [Rossellomorea sp. AcN35-11]|nr:hypothetical protein [Rossellomorea aquimaris]WJV32392.1 hypothetical protein QTG56_23830 [Rossellomorea sp. AcN35-11]